MDNTVLPQTENSTPKKPFIYKKSIIVSLSIIVVFALAIYFFLKYKKTTVEAPKPMTKEEKIDILNRLNKNPPNDGSVSMTTDEKLQILDTISTKKGDPNTKKKPSTPEEQQQMFNSIE